MANTFQDGDLAIVIDSRSRRFMVRLGAGRVFHTHHGHLAHDDIIGQEEGSRLKTQMDREMVVLRPSLADYILKMPRQSQVIYPKDIGPMLVSGDIHPGARVVEAGMGSGAMSMALLRAIGPMGRLTTYEVREDLATQALRNVEAFMPGVENFILRHADVYEGIEERDVNRVVLDLPEPLARGPDGGGRPAARRDTAVIPSNDDPDPPALRGHRRRGAVRPCGGLRGYAASLAPGAHVRPSGAPDGGPHRVHRQDGTVRGEGAPPATGRARRD